MDRTEKIRKTREKLEKAGRFDEHPAKKKEEKEKNHYLLPVCSARRDRFHLSRGKK